MQPSIEIVGVYRLPVTEELLEEQFEILYGFPMSKKEREEARRDCREQLESTVLIEALVKNADRRFKTGDLVQAIPDTEKEDWQAAWAEAYLTEAGEALLVERWGDPPNATTFRIAFFIHHWNPKYPLRTSYGDIQCPAPRKMPERLKKLVPYEPVD